MGRLTSGPLGSYTYGASGHVHAASSIGSAWTAAYDAAGNMTCRAPSSGATCAGTQTGAQLGYNNEGALQSWQNAPSSPTTSAQYLYDGQGQRVEQSVTQAGTTTTTVYVGDVEEVSTTGGTTTTTAYYYMAGKRIGLSVNGTISYLASDGLGSATVALSSSGSATAAQLFAPYGGLRYSSGTMPTTYGFTGQRSDSASGLDYYGARYYDPLAGQFTSGDGVLPGDGFDLWGLSRYTYVGGNPTVRTDPSGHRNIVPGDNGGSCDLTDPTCGGGNPDSGPGSGTPPQPCWMTGTCVPRPPPPPSGGGNGSGGSGSTAGPAAPPPPDRSTIQRLLDPSTLPPMYLWHHAQALCDASLGDPFGGVCAVAAIPGRSDVNDSDEVFILLLGALESPDPATSTAAWAGLVSGQYDPDAGKYLIENAFKAPEQTTPGTKTLSGEYINDTGPGGIRIEPWVAHYDEYGRLIARTDYNAGNAAAGIPDTHYHVNTWGPGCTPCKSEHILGEFEP
jgi:RHS repeat-associated protein